MTDSVTLGLAAANAICHQAIDLYAAERGEDVRPSLRFSVPFRSLRDDGDGWLHMANLTNDLDQTYRYILWHRETGRVRLGPDRR